MISNNYKQPQKQFLSFFFLYFQINKINNGKYDNLQPRNNQQNDNQDWLSSEEQRNGKKRREEKCNEEEMHTAVLENDNLVDWRKTLISKGEEKHAVQFLPPLD